MMSSMSTRTVAKIAAPKTTKLLAIDPGTNNLGWAVFDATEGLKTKLLAADVIKLKTRVAYDVFALAQKDRAAEFQVSSRNPLDQTSTKFLRANWWTQRTIDAVDAVIELADDYEIDTVVIEMPEHQGGARGAKAEGSGSIIKLAYLVGCLVNELKRNGCMVRIVRVRTWKGTTPKRLTQARMKRRWGHMTTQSPDAIDAVGIGTWYLFKRRS